MTSPGKTNWGVKPRTMDEASRDFDALPMSTRNAIVSLTSKVLANQSAPAVIVWMLVYDGAMQIATQHAKE